MAPESVRAVIVTVSDSCTRGEREDLSGPRARDLLRSQGFACDEIRVVPDEREAIAAVLRELCGRGGVRLVVTTGGTGLAPRDITPETCARWCDREAPGISEWLRRESQRETPHAVFSRAYSGMKGRTLVVNLPGSLRGAELCARLLAGVMQHGRDMAHGGDHEPQKK